MKTGQSYGIIAETSTWFKIISATWYTPMTWQAIWIVTWVSSNWQRKSYIWVGTWVDETRDSISIAETWAHFYPDTFRNLIS